MVYYVFDRRQLRIPILIALAIVCYAVRSGRWAALLGLPLIYFSWCNCDPNLNFVAGCSSALCTFLFLGIGSAFNSSSLWMAGAACGGTWLLASLESAWRASCPIKESRMTAYPTGRRSGSAGSSTVEGQGGLLGEQGQEDGRGVDG